MVHIYVIGLFIALILSIMCLPVYPLVYISFNKVKINNSGITLIHAPSLVLLDSNNWYQSFVPQRKFNNLREILNPRSMDMALEKKLEMALEDYDAKRLENLKLQNELNSAKEFILVLQEKLSSIQARRKELLQNQDDEEKDALKEQCHKLSQENMVMKNKMQFITMRMSKEIKD